MGEGNTLLSSISSGVISSVAVASILGIFGWAWSKFKKSDFVFVRGLSNIKKLILTEAESNRGELILFLSDQKGEGVRIKERIYWLEDDPEKKKALEELVNRGLLTRKSQKVFTLSFRGSRIAKKIKKKSRNLR